MNKKIEYTKKIKKQITIGVLLDHLFEDYGNQLLESLYEASKKYNVNLLSFTGGVVKEPIFYNYKRNLIYDLIDNENVDGLISISGSLNNYLTLESIKEFYNRFTNIPMINIGAYIKNIPSLIVDNEKGINDLIRHFVEIHKAKKIAFICGPEKNLDAISRLEAYKNALKECGIPIESKLIVPGFFGRASGREAIKILIDERKVKFDTIIGGNDYTALYAMKELQKRNIIIPDDIKVAGFDDIKENLNISPSLTTVRQPFYDLGHKSIKMLISIIEGKKVAQKTILPAQLIIRRSCGCITNSSNKSNILVFHLNNTRIKDFDTDIVKEKIKINLNNLISEKYHHLTHIINDEKWTSNLINSFFNEITGIKKRIFINKLKKYICTSISKGLDLSIWNELIFFLFENSLKYFHKKNIVLSIKNLFENVFTLINVIEEDVALVKRINEEENFILHQINWELSIASDLNEIEDILSSKLTRLGIKSYYIALYEGGNNNKNKISRLLFCKDIKTEFSKKYNKILFQSKQLIPGGIKNHNKERFSYLVMPLTFNDISLGFVIFDIANINGGIYESLIVQISSSINNYLLMTKLKEYTNELEKKVKKRTLELENSNKQKTQFFINLAHETKTPLTLITNYLNQYIQTHGMDQNLNIIKYNIDKLLNDMVNFLDLEKLVQFKIFYNHDQITNFSELLKTKIVMFEEYAKNKQINLTSNIEKGLFLKIDPYALDRIINNLLENSIKYTNRKGKIHVTLIKNKDNLLFEVKDNGIGIKNNQLKHIFKPYYQLSHKKQNIQGIGMGLSIVKNILDSINADITIQSELNKGSSFTLIFKNYDQKKEKRNINNFECAIPVLFRTERIKIKEEEIQKDKSNILLIDDNIELLYFLQTSLKKKYNVFLSTSGEKTLQKIREIPLPDVIISDIMMDDMDGFQLFSYLTKNQDYKNIPFIFLTAKSNKIDKLRGLKAGAVDYIYKPFVIDELTTKIDSIIKLNQSQKEKNLIEIKKKMFNFLDNIMEKGNGSIKKYTKFPVIYDEHNLTGREKEVMELLINGFYNKEISSKLNISKHTVEFHIRNIYKKFNVQNRVELVNYINKYTFT